jgi:hemolysin activation/secretion protein
VADAEGKSLTLSQLDEVAVHITHYYHNHGYPLAWAFIPAQTIESGIVRMEIMEARYGKIKLDNHSRVNDPLLQDTLAPLHSGQAIGQRGLDHTLLLLSDIPGVVVNATLKPGEAVGTADLLVQATPGSAVSGNVVLDNYGNRYTGQARLGGTANFNNPLHHGDYFNLSGLTSGSGMSYGRIAYESQLNGLGTRMGGSYSALHYTLGNTLASLNGHGTAQVGSLWARHPFVRRQIVNLYGQIQYDQMQLRDRIEASAIQTDRHLNNWTVSLAGDARDVLLAGAVNTWNVGWTSGRVAFDNVVAQVADAATASTQGSFSKWNASFSRLQGLSSKDELSLTFSGQGASNNLDPSEKMIAGGPYTVRAYDMGAVSGDTGYLLTAEFRHDLGQAWERRQWQVVGFVDSALVTVNKNLWPAAAAGTNSATLSGAGVGLNWVGLDQWSARAYIAKPLGLVPVLVGSTASARAWVEISKGL